MKTEQQVLKEILFLSELKDLLQRHRANLELMVEGSEETRLSYVSFNLNNKEAFFNLADCEDNLLITPATIEHDLMNRYKVDAK